MKHEKLKLLTFPLCESREVVLPKRAHFVNAAAHSETLMVWYRIEK